MNFPYRQSDEDNSSLTTSLNSRTEDSALPLTQNKEILDEDKFDVVKSVEFVEPQIIKSVTTAV